MATTKAYEFGVSELLRELKEEGAVLRRAYFRQRDTRRDLIICSACGSTFRAFRNLSERPSSMFRQWAIQWFIKGRMRRLGRCKSQEDFDQFWDSAHTSLSRMWRRQCGELLPFGKGGKLIDLVIKSVVRWTGFSRATRDAIIPFLHVPLDKFSLAAIRSAARTGEFGPLAWIPRGAMMGYVMTREDYEELQAVFRGVAEAAGVSPIVIDLLAWDKVH